MWDTIKKDPLIKSIVVILIGILAIGFAFNIMFGTGNSGMGEGEMGMSAGYSLSNILETIIALLFKAAVIALLIGFIVWIFRAIGKNTGSSQSDRFAVLKNDPIVKNALIIIGVVISILIFVSVLRGFSFSGYSEGEMMSRNTGSTVISVNGIQAMLVFLLKLLIMISFLGLGYGLFMYFRMNQKSHNIADKNNGICDDIIECPECKSKLNKNWKCCPICGRDKAFQDNMES